MTAEERARRWEEFHAERRRRQYEAAIYATLVNTHHLDTDPHLEVEFGIISYRLISLGYPYIVPEYTSLN